MRARLQRLAAGEVVVRGAVRARARAVPPGHALALQHRRRAVRARHVRGVMWLAQRIRVPYTAAVRIRNERK